MKKIDYRKGKHRERHEAPSPERLAANFVCRAEKFRFRGDRRPDDARRQREAFDY